MLTRTIHPKFGEKHKQYIEKAQTATMSVAEGAVRAGKTIDNVLVFAKLLYDGAPDKFHLATGSTSANAKLNIAECNGFGLEHIFRGRCKWTKYEGNDALRIKIGNRTYYVIFAGAGKADSYKKIQGNSYGMWIATEVNLSHESMIKTAFSRQLAARSRKMFWDLNPTAPASWIYTDYIDRFADQFGDKYNYEHFVIRDNASITQERFEEIERQYEPGTIWYRRDILGERCQAEGLIYPMFDPEKNVFDEHGTAGEWYISIDYGTKNPTVFQLWRLDGQTAYMEKEYFHDGRRDPKGQKTNEDYYNDLIEFAGDKPIKRIIIDPSASLKVNIRNGKRFHVRDADNEVINGVRFVGDLMEDGKIKIHNSCSNTLGELGLYCWDESKTADTVLKENDHSMDAMRYMAMTLKRRFTRSEYKPIYMR